MSDGMDGAGLLSWQLATYRMLDAMEDRRATNAASMDAARAWATANDVVRRYNQLAAAARQYRDDAIRRTAGLERRIKDLEEENARLRQERDAEHAKVVAYAWEKARRIASGLE